MTTNALEVPPVRTSQVPDVVIEQLLPGGVSTAAGADDVVPPPRPARATDAVEILPSADPNAIRRAPVRIGTDTRLQVATNAPGSLIVLVDGTPIDLVGEADHRSVSGVWIATTAGIVSGGSIGAEVLSAAASDRGADRTAMVTVIPQHFGARGWKVALGEGPA